MKRRLESAHGVTCHVLSADLTDPGAPDALFKAVSERDRARPV